MSIMVQHVKRGQNTKGLPTVNNLYTHESFPTKNKTSKGKNVRHQRLLRTFLALFFIATICSLVFWMSLPNVDYLINNNPNTTAFIELRKAEAVEKGERFSLRWQWRPLKQISPYLRYAVVKAEDGMFWSHGGVDWNSMRKVAEESWKEKKLPERGASTITQQLAKNLYLSPSKNPVRKLKEFFIARRLESELSKERILELYLNVSEWGGGVFGAEAAVQKWYAVSADALKPSQAARLTVALPNPFKRSIKQDAIYLDHEASQLLRFMHKAELISQEELKLGYADLGLLWKPKVDAMKLSKQQVHNDIVPAVLY